MRREVFVQLRVKLGKTQKMLAELLGVSLKSVQSYEQGCRPVPLHAERQLYLLAANQRSGSWSEREDCWDLKKCGLQQKCPAWEFQAGRLCWFLNGTQCERASIKDWKEKITVCRDCEVLTSLL
jgi:Predicted transcriptional regulator